MACPNREGCPVFPKLTLTLAFWKTMRCDTEDRFTGCARYRLKAAGEPVPLTLLPNGTHLSA